MRISLLGGTGDIGEGLALRWAHDTEHDIIIGSRDPDRARHKATEYETELTSRGIDRSIAGYVNDMAADRGDVIVLSVPPYYIADTIDSVADSIGDAIVVSPAVGMDRDDEGLHYNPPKEGSVTALAAASVPAGVPVVGAYHNLAADRIANLDAELNYDVPLISDDENAKDTVRLLTESITGLRALDAGGIANAPEVESLTPLLINLAIHNDGLHDLGVSFN